MERFAQRWSGKGREEAGMPSTRHSPGAEGGEISDLTGLVSQQGHGLSQERLWCLRKRCKAQFGNWDVFPLSSQWSQDGWSAVLQIQLSMVLWLPSQSSTDQWLKQQKFIFSHFWRLGFCDHRLSRADFFWGFSLWLVDVRLLPGLHIICPLCMAVPWSCFKNSNPTGLGSSWVTLFNLITF